ncbi:RNA polymerase-binding protein DksA [Herbaspirillum sp. CF444]|nr:RNA polymerase-binding protein DksA [Herbaspirillum sp. CF444]
MGVIAKKTVKKSTSGASKVAAVGTAAAKSAVKAPKTVAKAPPKMASRAATPVKKTGGDKTPAAGGKAGTSAPAAAKTAVAPKKNATSSTGNVVVVKSLTVKKTAPASAKPGTGKSAGKAIDSMPKKAVPSAAREVDSKATKSGTSAGGSKASAGKAENQATNQEASAGLKDKIEKPVVLKVSEVATKTPKTTPDTQTLLTEEQILKMGEKDYMNEAQLAFFKARLQQLEKDLLKNAGETTEHLRETVLVPDPADRATIEEEHALELRTRDRERKLLKKVQQSIVSIDAGEYGWCEETGEPIGIPRLLARPTATLSLEAQQRRELKQKLYGD